MLVSNIFRDTQCASFLFCVTQLTFCASLHTRRDAVCGSATLVRRPFCAPYSRSLGLESACSMASEASSARNMAAAHAAATMMQSQARGLIFRNAAVRWSKIRAFAFTFAPIWRALQVTKCLENESTREAAGAAALSPRSSTRARPPAASMQHANHALQWNRTYA